MAGIGGIIRDDKFAFVMAFAKNIGIASNNKAELWALKQGLQLVIQLEIRKIIIETDSLFLISCLRNRGLTHSSHLTLLLDVQRMMRKLERAIIKFGYGEVNGAADYMAKKGSTLHLNEEILLDQVDEVICSILSSDLNYIYKRCTTKICTDAILM